MSIANDALYSIRGGLGDLQRTRWSDTFILHELNRAAQRMLPMLKRNCLDYGQGRAELPLAAGADAFALPPDFRGVVGLYRQGNGIVLQTVDALETLAVHRPLVFWAVDGNKGRVKNVSPTDATLTLRYWQAPENLTGTASSMPWNGVFDGPLCDYVRLRLANYDEMTVAQDMQLMQDMENSVLTLAISRNPTVLQAQGWLA